VVSAEAAPLLPWLEASLQDALRLQAASALLLHGPQGNGQFELALALARSFICEGRLSTQSVSTSCGACAGCRLFAAATHPDLMVLVPEVLRESLGLPQAPGVEDGGTSNGGSGKAKPSKEIKVDEIRAAIGFAQSTSARGLGKVVLIHPAEAMNPIAANALLKTLEEPAGQTRYILSSNAVEVLLPTVRSRCLNLAVGLPSEPMASAWLQAQGVGEPGVLLRATGGRPVEALEWAQTGVESGAWSRLPKLITQGKVDALAEWPLSRSIQTLQKLCHDWMCVAVGAPPRYFPKESLGDSRSIARLLEWAAQLRDHARTADHPWQAALKIEALVHGGRWTNPESDTDTAGIRGRPHHRASIHSKP
jgi:DNA polymerase III subunit delta'